MKHDYYKEYYDLERNHWWFVAREKIITNYIKKLIKDKIIEKQNPKILNIGCGPGRSSEYLSQFGTVTSIEYDKYCCEFASVKTGLEIINGSITELPFKTGTFDLVCAFDVIEHVEDDQLAVYEMKRVAKKDALLLITVPAFMSLWSHHDVINHHFKRYKLPQIEKLFNNNYDGKKIYSTYFNFFLFPIIYLIRKMSNIFISEKRRPGSGSDFETFKPGIISDILLKIMSYESKLVSKKMKLPFGVSLLYSWKNFNV